MAVPSSQRQKRFLTDLKKKVPIIPCKISDIGLSYSDLVKLEKRASELQIAELMGGERLQLIRNSLETLEKWAASAIDADQSKDVRRIRESIAMGEDLFSRGFIKTVPLYKLITRANRKRLKLLDEYDSSNDPWLPLSISSTPMTHLEGILTPEDQAKLQNLYNRWEGWVGSGYFDLQAALELLHGVHETDLCQHSSYPLLQKALNLLSLDLSKIDAEPLYVRLRSSALSKLIAIVSLSPALGDGVDIPPTYATEVAKAIERANDGQFKKLCDQSFNMLLIRTYPQKVGSLIYAIQRSYGQGRTIRPRKSTSTTNRSLEGMQTRSSRTSLYKTVKLKQVSLMVLERTLKEGERLARLSRSDKEVAKAVDSLREAIEEIRTRKNNIDMLVDTGDISTWTPIEDLSNLEYLWVYKVEVDSMIGRFINVLSGLRPELYRDQVDAVKRVLRRLRIEQSLVVNVLTGQAASYLELEETLSIDGSESGLLAFFAERVAMIRSQLKTKLVGLSIAELGEWLTTVTAAETDGPIRISVSDSETVNRAKSLHDEAEAVVSSVARVLQALGGIGPVGAAAETLQRLNLGPSLRVILGKVSDLSMQLQLVDSQIEWLRVVDWFHRATSENEGDINALIELHSESQLLNAEHVEGDVAVVLSQLSERVANVTSLISEITAGGFSKLSQATQMGLISAEIERVKMDIEDYHNRLGTVQGLLTDQGVRISVVTTTAQAISGFRQQYGLMEDDGGNDFGLSAIIAANNSLTILGERDAVEETLEQLTRFESPEISRANRHLEKTKELESQIDQVTKKHDSVNTSFSKLIELSESKTLLLKKSGKLRIGLSLRGKRKLLISLHTTLCNLMQQWHSAIGLKPKWVYLFILKAVGVFLQLPVEWVSRQVDACTEILKDAKKSLSEFSKARFMVPVFHVSLYEPLEKIRANMESKLGVSITLNYASTERRVESISSHDLKDGRVRERIFPKLGGPSKTALIEPSDSQSVSDLFDKRKTPESYDQSIEQMLLLCKAVMAEATSALETAGLRSKAGSGPNASSGDAGAGMSFTKFLSSSFSSLDIGRPSPTAADPLAELLTSGATPGKSFLDRYYDQLKSGGTGSPASGGASTPIEIRKPGQVMKPVVTAPPPGFAAPPKSIAVSPDDSAVVSSSNGVVVWKGDVVGPKHAFKLPIALYPLFRNPSPGIVKQVLMNHQSWQFEGSLGIGKFSEHYSKLMHPAHRAKREPYSFLITSEVPDRVLESVPVNTASAFAIIVAPYKIKLWIACGDGSVSFQSPLPLLPRIYFAFIEMPLPLMLNVGPVENVFDPTDLTTRLNSLPSEDGSAIQAPLVVEEPLPSKPMRVVEPVAAEDPSLTKVYQSFAQGAAPPPAPLPSPRPRSEPPVPPPQPAYVNPMTAYYGRPAAHPSAMSSLVIGAPSTGSNIDQLPNPRRGICRFYNTSQGCQSGSRCRFTHACAVCGHEDHTSSFHEGQQYYRY